MSSTLSTRLQFGPVLGSSLAHSEAQGLDWFTVALLAGHAVLGVLVSRYPLLSTGHALLTLVIGLVVAARSRNKPERVAYVAAYIVGAEVLWRMTEAHVFWEFGKYASSAVLLLFLVLHGRRLSWSAVLYFGLLMPSIVLTAQAVNNFSYLQQSLSFYLSGPLALAVAWCFFSQLKLSEAQLQRLFLALICPTVSVAANTLFGTLSRANLTFTDESNFATSGGFGPNQVSGALSLGVVLALLWLLTNKGSWINKAFMFAVLAFLSTQAVMTFSRGGLYNAVGASAAALFFLMRDRRSRARVIMAVAAIVLVAVFVVLPQLEHFTGGAISTRFKDVNLAHRDEIMRSDLLLWRDNPILGVGPGMAAVHRRMPHTEITRLLAEHGLFGLAAIVVLTIAAIQSVRRARNNSGKAFASSMVTFSLLFMLDKAMRLAAPSFAFGLAFATVIPNLEIDPRFKRELTAVLARRQVRRAQRLRASRVLPGNSTEPSQVAAAELG